MKHILVVDDDQSVLKMLTRALSAYDLTIARGGSEALLLAGQCEPDLLITDYLMPEMTGDELIARMRKLRPRLKALVITGHGDVLDRELPHWWQSEAHLAKPFRIQALREVVTTLIGAA